MLMPQISYTDLCSPVRWSPFDLIGTDDTHSAIPYSTLIGFISKLSHGFPTTKGGNNYFILKKSDILPFQEKPLLTWQGAKPLNPARLFSCLAAVSSVFVLFTLTDI